MAKKPKPDPAPEQEPERKDAPGRKGPPMKLAGRREPADDRRQAS